MLTEQSIVTTQPDLATADLGGEAVLLDASNGQYYGLNEVGLRVFELAQEPRSVNEIVALLLDEFEVDEARLRADVLRFLQQMEERSLIRVEADAQGD